MKTLLYAFVAVFLLAGIIDAAPPKSTRPPRVTRNAVLTKDQTAPSKSVRSATGPGKPVQSASLRSKNAGPINGKSKRQFVNFFQGSSVYPNYYIQQASPLIDFQNAFLEAAFLSGVHYNDLKQHNLTDSAAKALPLDVKTDVKGATDLKAKIVPLDGTGSINIINPFLSAKDFDGKSSKVEGDLPAVEAGKLGDSNSSLIGLINPFQGGRRINAVFGPELAPRYEIHYTPQGVTLDPLPPFAGLVGPAPIGLAHVGPAVGPVGPFPGFGVVPSFNTLLSPYPFPPFPGFDPKSLKPNGKSNGNKKPDSTEASAEPTTESYHEPNGGPPPTESSSESAPESQPTEGPQ